MDTLKPKTILTGLLLSIVLLVCLEAALHVAGFKYNRYGLTPELEPVGRSPVDSIVVPDPERLWKFKPGGRIITMMAQGDNLSGGEKGGAAPKIEVITNSLGLRNEEIGQKSAGENRVLVLGDSATFGDGVQAEDTYSERLEGFLKQRLKKETIEVVNAGIIGYSSLQSLLLLESLGPVIQPDVVLVFNLHSDLKVHWFHDSREVARGGRLKLLKLLYQARIYHLARAGISFVRRMLLKNAVRTGKVTDHLGPRVTLQEYRENLKSIVEVSRKLGAKMLFIIPPLAASLPVTAPLFYPAGSQAPYNEGLKLLKAGRPAEARDSFTEALRYGPEVAIFHHFLGLSEQSLGHAEKAEASLKKAKELDLTYTALQEYRTVMRDVASEHGIALVDLPTSFEKYRKFAAASGKKFFLDDTHPTSDGHAVIATELLTALKKYVLPPFDRVRD
ncbi:MAG: hypothetical protein QGH40_05685 [bacterium]|jgi:lysophospholipase L1-like esterase|nr:hypothetical protein [bacterium]